MEAGRPSTTAERAAIHRAAHQVLDQPPILIDPIAARLVTEAPDARPAADEHPAVRRLRAGIALRSRYAEDRLADAVRAGTSQLIVLGAGLDSFAYRNPFPHLRVFEVDHPATQAWKRARLEAAGIALPPSLRFVPVDFEREALRDALVAGGVDPSAPAFVSWLGVTVYLTRDAVLRTLAAVAALAPGSDIVFEYGVPPETLPAVSRAAIAAMAARAASHGEPWQTFFAPDDLAAELTRLGFAVVEDVGPEESMRRYFAGRTDGLRPGSAARLMHARMPAT
jgi:methyltransferase (TIGR00027 family)